MTDKKHKAHEQGGPDQEARLKAYRKLCSLGYTPIPLKPDSKKSTIRSPKQFLKTMPSEAALQEWSGRTAYHLGILLTGDVKFLFFSKADKDVWGAITVAFGDRAEETPSCLGKNLRGLFFRSPGVAPFRRMVRHREGKQHWVTISDQGSVRIPGLVEGDFPGPLEWIDPDQSLFVKGVDDLPNLTDEQLDELKLALEAIGFTGENIPNSGNATRPKRTAREGGKSDSASAGVETVAEDPSRAPVHERILARMTEIGVETRFNISTGYQEFRGGFVGKDWRPANDRITARILSDVPGRPIGIARGRQAFGTILCDREVIPQGEHLGNVPPTNDTTVYEELLKDRFIAECRPEYATAVLRSFMFSVARMNLRPGHAQEFLPVLIGSRRSAISALLRGLCPDPRWYTNSIPFAGRGRKPSEAMRGKMIGEVPLDELDSAAASTLDAVVTHDTAHPQMPVAGGPDDFPPLCGLIGTAFNLVSLDGGIKVNPHLLPVPIETELPDHEVEQWARENADRFWGLARNDHESGRLPADMLVETLEMREETVDRLRAGDELRYGSIERHVRSLAPGDQFSLAELFCAVEIPRRGGDDNLVADFLKKELGFEKSEQKRHNDKRTMVWTVPEEIRPSDGSGPDRQKPARRKG